MIQLLLWSIFGKLRASFVLSLSLELHNKCHRVVIHPCRNILKINIESIFFFFWTEIWEATVWTNFIYSMQFKLVWRTSVLQVFLKNMAVDSDFLPSRFAENGSCGWQKILPCFSFSWILSPFLRAVHVVGWEQYNKMYRLLYVMALI